MKALHVLLILVVIIVIIIVAYFIINFVKSDSFTQSPQYTQLTQASKRIKHEKNKIIEKVKPSTDHRILYELNHTGVPDVYDLEGNKINGTEPDPLKVIYHLELLLNSDKASSKDFLFEAKLYHQGMHKMQPDLNRARGLYEQLYTRLYNKMHHTEMSNEELDTMAECVEGIEQLEKIRVYAWLNLPINDDQKQENEAEIEEVFNFHDNIRNTMMHNEIANDMRNFNFDDNFDHVINHEDVVRNDPQNVHNSTVLKTIKNSLKNISKDQNLSGNKMGSVNEIRDIINKSKNSDKKQDALKSLDTIMMQNTTVHSLDMDELGILDTVWKRIKDKHMNNDDVINTLIEQLADMQEYGRTVCSVGRATRLVDTLNVVDEDVKIIPTYAINSEMMNKAANIRNISLEGYNKEERHAIEAGTSVYQTEYEDKLKNDIINELKKDYVNTGILTEEKFNMELSKWINEI